MPRQKRFETTLYSSDWLRRVYIEEGRNASEVAALINCTPGAVLDALRRHGIPVKTMSEVIKNVPHVGSSVPRPKQKFLGTLYNGEWVLARKHLNASELAREAGCSVPIAQNAMRRFGLEPPAIRGAKSGRRNPKRMVPDDTAAFATFRARARAWTPEGPCVLCGGVGSQVNHKDRNPKNNDPVNLERLCQKCHSHQHGTELWVMVAMLAARGISYMEVHAEARRQIHEGCELKSPYSEEDAEPLDGR